MGFIKKTFAEIERQYVSMRDVVLYAATLDGSNPSLSDTAKFLLLHYKKHSDVDFLMVDYETFYRDLSGEMMKSLHEEPFRRFLSFVVECGVFDEGVDYIGNFQYNQYSELYLKRSSVKHFLANECNIKLTIDLDRFLSEKYAQDQPHLENEAVFQEALNITEESTTAETPTETKNPKTANLQLKIIAALATMYTKTDCSKPYEAAETILQEWARQSDTLGNPPCKDTLGRYIKEGKGILAS